ncbi:EF-hand calcium-binding domain-containing protein 8 isoform X1 [Tupaia chinensis]|uniref:EF-hand calcium-binding domain-containing protein 8 isoform X1 n=3 Tax=Tupaia chinensis TaxID=246437 RepID=UPI0003C8E25C|nr:EF-hand calcium-binding domain-containing protein 8 isoform X1 [Tupaia chinensis]
MSQMGQESSNALPAFSSQINWGDQMGSGSRLMSSESSRENTQALKLSITGFQNKEALSAPKPSVTQSQLPDVQHKTQLFTEIHLAEIEKMFDESISSTGALNMEMFIKAMKKILRNASNQMLESLFLKVDSDCNGFVTWPEYVDYMMREFRGKEEMRKSQYRLHFHLPMRIIPLNHGCEVVKVEFLIHRFKKVGCFLTVTKDGILQFWTESFSLISSFRLNKKRQLHSQQRWVIDMVCLHNVNLIAVASTEQQIDFFDVSNHKCVQAFTFTDLDSCVLVMDYWSDYQRGVFCYGDTKGNVIIFTSDNVTNGLFNPHILPRASKRDHWVKVSTQKLLNEKSPSHRSYRLRALHPNWCQQVKFIPELNLVVSCSAIEKSSLVLTILPVKASEKPKLSVLNLRKGILCFDYCPDKNFLVTGGYDPLIRLWNPLVSKRPVWLMKGHQTSVTHIIVNSKNNNILISVSKDKNIRVWDMQDYVCLQSFYGRHFSLGNCPITSAYFHKKNDTLICSTFSIGILTGYLEAQGPMKAGKLTTHSSSLCAILYSKIFKQVVSGCQEGMVSVWEIVTGKKTMEFSVSGAKLMELTAMALDESERCLLTGLRDGTVKMWNYNIGECLLTFPNPDQLEVSGIVHMNQVFYMTGWNRRITYFMFHKTKPVLLCYQWQTFHSEDILSMAKYQNQFIGTSSYNGEILFWNINLLKPILSFNASESPLPLQPKKVQVVDDCRPEDHRPTKPCMEKWVHKVPVKHLGPGAWTTANATLRRNLVSAPPVMRGSRDKESDWHESQQVEKPVSAGRSRQPSKFYGKQPIYEEVEKKEEFRKKLLLQSSSSVEKIIFLQTRPRLPNTAALLSSCIDGYIYAWSIHGNGGLLGKFPVDFENDGSVVVGAMATDENDWILITGDCNGHIKIWDIKNYCTFIDHRLSQPAGAKTIYKTENKFQSLIPRQLGTSLPHYIPLEEKKVVDGQTISLVPPKLLITWKGHLDSVADILYVESFQLVISAGQDRNVKAWKLSGDAIGTFGLDIWKRLQDTPMDGLEEEASLEEKADSKGTAHKPSRLELHREERDLAEALVYQRREQVALMALLNGKADTEAEAWARLQKMALVAPWAKERPLEDIEDSWSKWESTGKQVSKILGTAYKPKERSRSPRILSTNVKYGWMKQQISPQIYQSLYFSQLTPIQQPNFMVHRPLDQQGRRIHLVTRQKDPEDLEPDKAQTLPDTVASTPAATLSHFSLLSSAASASRLLDSNSSASPKPQFSMFSLRPWSASTALSSSLAPSQVSESILQRLASPMPITSSLEWHPGPLKAALAPSMKQGSHVRF